MLLSIKRMNILIDAMKGTSNHSLYSQILALTHWGQGSTSLELQKMGHPLTHFSSCWKTFLEQTWARVPRWVELSQDRVDVSPTSWPRLARLFTPSYKCLWREPYSLSVKSSCSTFCNYSLPHFCMLKPQEHTGLVGKRSRAQQDPH